MTEVNQQILFEFYILTQAAFLQQLDPLALISE